MVDPPSGLLILCLLILNKVAIMENVVLFF